MDNAKNILVVHLRYIWKRSDNIKQMRNGNSQSNAFHTEYEILIEISTSFTYLDFFPSPPLHSCFFFGLKTNLFLLLCTQYRKTFIWIPRNSWEEKKWKGEKLMTSPIRHSTFLFRVIFYQSSNFSVLFFVFCVSFICCCSTTT